MNMNSETFVNTLKYIASIPTGYYNKYPHNLGYWDGKKFTFDCWNLIKSVLNGWTDTRKVGYCCKNFSVTGDIDGATILSKCTTKSKDFAKLSYPGTYLYMSGHAGTYIGLTEINGKQYNVIECTTSFGGGVLYSWVDIDGTRRKYKGGTASKKWTDWGLLCWVDYIGTVVKPDPQPQPQPQTIKVTDSVKGVQEFLNKNYGLKLVVDGICGKATKAGLAKAYQCELNRLGAGLAVDGDFGPASQKAYEKYVGSIKNGSKGIFVTLWQCLLRCYGQNPKGIDGQFGANTTAATNALFKGYALPQDGIVNGTDVNRLI